MAMLLNLVYLGLLLFVSPVLLYRRIILGKYRDGWSQKFLGLLPENRSDRPLVWIHAVSVGEVLQLRRLIEQFEKTHPQWQIMISTTTSTGYAVAQQHYDQQATIVYFPLDFSWSVKNAIKRTRPRLILLVELELWPNFIRTADSANIPLAIINGRLSAHSFRGYRRIRPLIASLLHRFAWIGVQNPEYAERFRQLGAPLKRIEITGSIKYDHLESNRGSAEVSAMRDDLGLDPSAPVMVVGSTQAPEERIGLSAYRILRAEYPELRLIVVPRHRERFEEVADLIRQSGFSLHRRSSGVAAAAERDPVLLLDTLGELSACWGLSHIAFVGGSLTRRGGQNMMEPAAYGSAVLFGPHTQNFRDVVHLLLEKDAARVIRDETGMVTEVRRLLSNPVERRMMGNRAAALVASQQGALLRTMCGLQPLLGQRVGDTRLRAA